MNTNQRGEPATGALRSEAVVNGEPQPIDDVVTIGKMVFLKWKGEIVDHLDLDCIIAKEITSNPKYIWKMQ